MEYVWERVRAGSSCMKTLRAFCFVWVGRLDDPTDPYEKMKHEAERQRGRHMATRPSRRKYGSRRDNIFAAMGLIGLSLMNTAISLLATRF